MDNSSFVLPGGGSQVELTVGRATGSGVSAALSTNIVSDLSQALTLPATNPSYYMAAWPDMNDSANRPVHLNGFTTDTPGAGMYYYTIWMSSSTAFNYTTMASVLTVLNILP